MIARIWHGITTKENADAYESLLEQEIFEGIANKKIKGYKGIQLLKRENDAIQLADFIEKKYRKQVFFNLIVPLNYSFKILLK